MFRNSLLLALLWAASLTAGSWSAGLGGGNTYYVARDSLYRTRIAPSPITSYGWRVEAEAGYYAGKEGFDIFTVYGEHIVRNPEDGSFLRDQHLGLLGEYRLFGFDEEGKYQGALGLGPALHRVGYYSNGTRQQFFTYFAADAEASFLIFLSRHFHIRIQGTYSFPPLNPLYGAVLNLTLRVNYRT